MMEKNLDVNKPVAPAGRPEAARSDASAAQGGLPDRRRRWLLGGSTIAAPLIFTLSSRPALAKKKCTISGTMSGVGSHTNNSKKKGSGKKCGSSTTEWSNADQSAWSDAGYNKSSSTFDSTWCPGQQTFTDSHGTCKVVWTVSGSLLLLNMLKGIYSGGTVTCTVTEAVGKSNQASAHFDSTNSSCQALLTQYVAAVLNNNFYGNSLFGYVPISCLNGTQSYGSVYQSIENANVSGSAQNYANIRCGSGVTNTFITLANTVSGWNGQGG
jgi:hypothetical protein